MSKSILVIDSIDTGYNIDTKGNIYGKRGKTLKQFYTSRGYLQVSLCYNSKQYQYLVHRLVLITFVPNPKNKCCGNHIDGVKTNNFVENLEWATHSENNKHSYDIGLKVRIGKLHLYEKEIIKLYSDGYDAIELSKKYNCAKNSIYRVLKRNGHKPRTRSESKINAYNKALGGVK
jgi:hypothetical protein